MTKKPYTFWWHQAVNSPPPPSTSQGTHTDPPRFESSGLWNATCRRADGCIPDNDDDQHCFYCGKKIEE